MRINLLSAAAAAAIAAALIPSATFAQTKTVYVAAYGGSFEQTMRRDVIPPFEKKFGVKIEYVHDEWSYRVLEIPNLLNAGGGK